MQMHEGRADQWDRDYRGKTVLLLTCYVTEHREQIPAHLRGHAVTHDRGWKISGFLLGKVVDISIHGGVWISVEGADDTPRQYPRAAILKLLLDDEGEPDFYKGLPRLL